MDKNKYWQDPGILRKKSEDVQELLIFGYASKLFRDDTKAQEIDQGKHLIPWMGDDSLKIDRYDARGHLSDLTPYEPSNNSNYVLTPEERKFEEVLNNERYQFLNPNEQENQMYQEEELKRLKQELRSDNAYGQVQYQYQDNPPSQSSTDNQEEEDDEPFVPSPLLDIPTNLVLPKTEKENVRIEKTASHVAAKGVQLEIIIKARQTHNPKFQFMQLGNPLNPYYTFLVAQIKSGRYKPKDKTQEEENVQASEDHYLHPSLASASIPLEAAPSIPSIPYKPSPDCAYLALVQNIKTVQQISQEPAEDVQMAYAMQNAYYDGYSQYEYDQHAWNVLQTQGYPSSPSNLPVSSDNPYSALVQNIRSVQASEPHLRTTARNSASEQNLRTTSQSKKTRFSDVEQNTEQVDSEMSPPDDIKKMIFKVVKFAQSQNPEVVSKLFQSDCQKFGFLQPGHRYHKFYMHHLMPNKEEPEDVVYDPANPTNTGDPDLSDEDGSQIHSESMSPSSDVSEADMYVSDTHLKEEAPRIPTPPPVKPVKKSRTKPAPVSFSIKKPKEEKLEVTSVLIEESSSGEDDPALKSENTGKTEKQATQPVVVEKLTHTADAKLKGKNKEKSALDVAKKKERERTEDSNKRINESSAFGVVAAVGSTGIVANPNVVEPISQSKDDSSPLNGTVKQPSPPVGLSSKNRHKKRKKSSHEKSRKTKESKQRTGDEETRVSTIATIAATTTLSELNHSTSKGSSHAGKKEKSNDEELDKKREERRRRARELVEKLKEKAQISDMLRQRGFGQPNVESPALEGINLQTTGSFFGQKSIVDESLSALEGDKEPDKAKVEKELRQKVKDSLSKILESNCLPPIPEEDSMMSFVDEFSLLDRPPSDTDDTGRLSVHEHLQSKSPSRESSQSRDVQFRRAGSEDSTSLSKFRISQHNGENENTHEENSLNGLLMKKRRKKHTKSIDESDNEEKEEVLEIRPEQVEEKLRLRVKDSLTKLLGRSHLPSIQEDGNQLNQASKRRHSLSSDSDDGRHSKNKKSSSRESSLSLETKKQKLSKSLMKRNKMEERRSPSKEQTLRPSGPSIEKLMEELVKQNGSHKKQKKKHKKHSSDVTRSKKHHHVYSSNESLADSSDSSSSSALSSTSVHKKSKKKHKHRKSKKESKKSKKKHRKRKRSPSTSSFSH